MSIHDGTRKDLGRRFVSGELGFTEYASALEHVAREQALDEAWEANRDNCPSWCEHHELTGVHSRCINVGGAACIAIEQVEEPTGVDPHGAYVSLLSDLEDGVQGDDLHGLIAALVEAQRLIEGR